MKMYRHKESWDYGMSGVQLLYSCDTDDLLLIHLGKKRSRATDGWLCTNG